MASSAERDQVYLDSVLTDWRSGFARAEGENMPELYAAAVRRVRAGDWTQVRPLLRVLRTIVRINATVTMHLSIAQLESRDPEANPAVATALQETAAGLRAALGGLEDALTAIAVPGEPTGLGAGEPHTPGRLFEPDLRSVRGIIDTAVVAAVVGANSVVSVVRTALATKNSPPPPPAP